MNTVALITEPIPADTEAGLGCLSTERGNLPLTDVDVSAKLIGLLHTTSVQQVFNNPFDEPIEATYIFPLPDRAAVTAFRLTTGDRVVEGNIQERAAARQAYDDAIASGRVAAIAEQERPNIFTVRVGNLMPRASASVELTLTGPLALDAGEATWRFPLVVAPRYIPGNPLPGASVGDGTADDTDAVPDASRITPPILLPGFPNPVRLAVRVALDQAGLPVTNLRCSLPANVDEDGLTLNPGQRLDRDLLVRFDIAPDAVRTSAIAHDGTFALTLIPPRLDADARRPRDVVFVLDRSGSMQGWKMTAARRAVARVIDTLGPADRFAVYAFDDVIEEPAEMAGLVAATDRNRFRGVEFLANLAARGGTEMLEPLRRAVSLLGEQGTERDRVLVLATDGQVGNEDQILAALSSKVSGTRIFTVGIDTAVNDSFLRRLAAIGAGSCELVESEDRLDAVMERIHRRIGAPVLTSITVKAAGVEIESLAPQRFGALYPGVPLVVLGRYRGESDGAITVTATDAAEQPWSATVPIVSSGNETLFPAWARGRIRDLEDQYVVSPSPEVEREIVRTSLAAKVLCRFTAFVAIDVRVVNEGGEMRRITQPVDAPHGWAMFDAAPMQPVAYAMAPQAAAPVTGVPAPAPMYGPPVPFSPAKRSRWGLGGGGGLTRGAVERRDEEKAVPAAELLDLAPYRARAAALVDRVADGSLDGAGLRRELTDLVDDLRSVSAAADVVEPLQLLLTELRANSWKGDVTALREFAAGAGVSRARRAFWKR